MAVQWETAMMLSQAFAAVVYRVETYFSSFGLLFVDFGVVRQLVLYLGAVLVFPFVKPHHGVVFL